MKAEQERTAILLGEEAVEKLQNSKIIIFGVGGVGSYVTEAVARAGVGSITIVDHDTVTESNINRQIVALHSTVGQSKVDVAKERILDINPDAKVTALEKFISGENVDEFSLDSYDYIVDAIDTVSSKILLVEKAAEYGVPIICSMGTGNKLDPTRLEVADIYDTSVCPLARVMRRELKAREIKKLKVVYSREEPRKSTALDPERGRPIVGSVSFVPSSAGLIIAGEVIKDLIK